VSKNNIPKWAIPFAIVTLLKLRFLNRDFHANSCKTKLN
jgi:hypothetical protein